MSIAVMSILAGAGPAHATPDFTDVEYLKVNGVSLTLDIYQPEGPGPFPGLVVAHGAIRAGDKTDYAEEAQILSDNGFVVFAANYRMSCNPQKPPKNVDPKLCGYHAIVPVEDLLAAVSWVRANAGTYGVIPDRVGAFGGSFGGNLVQMLGTMGEPGTTKPDAVVSWSGSTELWRYRLSSDPERAYAIRLAYTGCPFKGTGSCPHVWRVGSPIKYVTAEDVPTYLANSTAEQIPLVEATDMQSALQAAGVPVFLRVLEGSLHARAYEDVVVDEAGTTVFQESMAFLHDHLG
jgi:dipeptidyl aminopeptidase/acylaminoacyl peptidase